MFGKKDKVTKPTAETKENKSKKPDNSKGQSFGIFHKKYGSNEFTLYFKSQDEALIKAKSDVLRGNLRDGETFKIEPVE